MGQQRFWTLVVLFFAFAYELVLHDFLLPTGNKEISYGAFQRLVAVGRVQEVVIDEEELRGILRDSSGGRVLFSVIRKNDPMLISQLEKADYVCE